MVRTEKRWEKKRPADLVGTEAAKQTKRVALGHNIRKLGQTI